MILTEASKESIWLKGLISNLGFPWDKTIIFFDTLNAIYLAKDQVHNERTKHMDIIYHFIHTKKKIATHKVDTKENSTDMFTKHVPRSKFIHCLDLLSVNCQNKIVLLLIQNCY